MTHTTKHTSGPWVPYNSDKGRIFSHWYIRVDSGPTIVTVHNGLPDNQDMGNAHLIAAAPVMFEALREAQELIRSLVAEEMIHSSELQRVGNCQANMWEALAQAEGGGHE